MVFLIYRYALTCFISHIFCIDQPETNQRLSWIVFEFPLLYLFRYYCEFYLLILEIESEVIASCDMAESHMTYSTKRPDDASNSLRYRLGFDRQRDIFRIIIIASANREEPIDE